MLARLVATAAVLLAALSQIARAAENEPVKTSAAGTTVRNDADRPGTDKPQINPAGSQASTRSESTTETAKPAPRNTRVLYITAGDCDRCAEELARFRKSGGLFESMQAKGWKIGEGPENHIQIVDREEIPELVQKLNVREYPTVACISNGEIVRSFKDGCSTPLDAWTFGWLIKGESERPQAAIPEAIRVKSTGSYRLRGNHWSVEGDWNPTREKVITHLRGTHGGSVSATYAIDGWSYEELRSLHDDIHEREGGSVSASGYYSGSGYYQAPQPRGADQFSAGRKMMGL